MFGDEDERVFLLGGDGDDAGDCVGDSDFGFRNCRASEALSSTMDRLLRDDAWRGGGFALDRALLLPLAAPSPLLDSPSPALSARRPQSGLAVAATSDDFRVARS